MFQCALSTLMVRRGLHLSALRQLPMSGRMSVSHPHVLFQKEVKVPSFGGSLWVDTCMPVKVLPIGPPEHPTMDRASVKVRTATKPDKSSSSSSSDDSSSSSSSSDEDELCTISQQGHKLQVEAGCEVGHVAEIKVPLVHSINVTTSLNGSIDAEDFIESKYCILKSESGDVTASRIKSEVITLETESGDVYLNGNMQGKLTIATGAGNVVCDKRIVGPTLDVTTDSGDIRIAASYSETAKFSTNTGSLNLRNLHNESYIAVYEQGDCKAHGIDGQCNIFVKKGDVDVHISQLSAESRIHVEEGDVVLRISDVNPVKISIEANDIIPDTKFANHGKIELCKEDGQKHYFCAIHPNSFSPSVTVLAENGNVILESQDWAASLGLKLTLDDRGVAPKPSFTPDRS